MTEPLSPKLRVVVCAYVFDQDKVFLIYKAGKNFWVPPGGHVEAGETLGQALHRELFEETGLRAEFVKSSATQFSSSSKHEPIPSLVFSGTSKFGEASTTLEFAGSVVGTTIPTLDPSEALEGKWWPLSDLENLSPTIRERVRLAHALLTREK